ncbi:MAG: hypothetical protein V8S22_06940 [Lachnospiraceae bacterium]
MDDFREWLSDNLRYFLLGFAILAVVIIAVAGIRIYQREWPVHRRNRQTIYEWSQRALPLQEKQRQ